MQQLREALPGDHPYRFVIHDRDNIFSADVDKSLTNLGVRVLRTPVRAPKANSVCERLGGSLRRECLDFLIPFNERHLQMIIRDWTTHYNRGRPHSSLGPGLPEPMLDPVPPNEHRHRLPLGYRVAKRSVLGGLHHEYGLGLFCGLQPTQRAYIERVIGTMRRRVSRPHCVNLTG